MGVKIIERPPIERACWSPAEFGAAVGICHATVHGLIRTKRVRSTKVGRRRFILEDPKEWLAASAESEAAGA